MIIDGSGRARLRAPIVPLVLHVDERDPDFPTHANAGILASWHGVLAPEELMEKTLDHRADVFVLAALLYEALSGRFPYRLGTNFMTALLSVLKNPLEPVGASAPDIDHVLACALAKNKYDRFHGTHALAAALRHCVPDAHEYDAVVSDRVAAWREHLDLDKLGLERQ